MNTKLATSRMRTGQGADIIKDCIVTGTSIEMSLLIQINKLDKEKSSSIENVDLAKV